MKGKFMFKKLILIASLVISSPVMANDIDAVYLVQHKVNTEIQFTAERDGKDVWQIPVVKGDCEDFALLKRKILIEKYNFSPEDLQLLLLFKPTGKPKVYEGHTVLYVKSLDLILDNSSSKDMKYPPMPTKYDDFLKRNDYKFRCVFKDLNLGQVNGPVTSRC